MQNPTRIPELRPEIVFVFDLVRQLAEGRVRIPRFQRPFVWSREQMLDLLDSINRQYPIGSLLVWETDDPLASLEAIGPTAIDTSDRGLTPTFVLDGHQRLSTIAGALISESKRTIVDDGDEDPARWSMFYNARDNTFEHIVDGGHPAAHQFPMSKILDTFEFLDECNRLLRQEPELGRGYVERVQDVARAFQNYKIPVIQIRQTDLNEAVEIFARLNSRGQAMTADQMVSALLYKEGSDSFNLASAIDDSMEMLVSEGFGGIERTLVLRALLAAVEEDIYRTDWSRIARTRRDGLLDKIRDSIDGVNESLSRAVDFLKNDLGVKNHRLLPYAMQLIVLSSFFFAQPAPSSAQLALMRKWFWASSFSAWFGVANPSRVNALVRDVMDNVARERAEPRFSSFDTAIAAAPIPRSFDMRSARTRVLLLAMMSLKPLGRDGEPIEVDKLIEQFGPSALSYVAASVSDSDLVRSPANRIFQDDLKDRRQARSWLLSLSPVNSKRVLASHAIEDRAISLLSSGKTSDFLRERLESMRRVEDAFMASRGLKPPPRVGPSGGL
ncbi:DUF262 domain-containing protein [Agromyces badenianii]|uniref:DUF262 domain-containing protein n=1 Tax=Agromyces badenianii TaxID=2080742 RepID=UPI00140433C6|nr:DUF262 domain-containing protein [Agromyces badenianii]